MMTKRYIKKPIPVEAIVWTGENVYEIICWSGAVVTASLNPAVRQKEHGKWDLRINTLEGVMRPNIGDYVVKGSEGEFWFVRKAIFEKTYFEYNPDEHGVLF